MNQKQLRALIQEQVSEMMSEQEVAETPDADAPDTPSSASVDELIDELLLQYEKLSLPSEEEELLEMMKNASLRMILEQEEVDVEVDVEEEEGEADAAPEAEAEEGEADSEEESEETTSEKVPSLDIGSFALKVARLAEMPEKVLDLKDAIINRAIQYLQSNYNDNVAKEFESALMDRFQLAVPEEEVEVVVASDLPSPPAVGAGPGGAAGG